MMTDQQNRLARLREVLRQNSLDCLIVTGDANRFYLSGFTGDNGVLIIGWDEQLLFTDFRYLEQAGAEAPLYEIKRCPLQLLPEAGRWLAERSTYRIGFESDHLSFGSYGLMTESLPPERLAPTAGMVEALRALKDAEEIRRITDAAAIADRAWHRLLPSIREGAVEMDLAAELDYLMRGEGAEASAFATIVASGPRSALPHASPTRKRLSHGDLVIFDFGAVSQQYRSDMTRTVVMGEAGAETRKIYDVVLEAQRRALAALRPGMTGREADAVARQYIEEAGYGENFGHGLGHAVGIEIHEDPRLSLTGETILRPGMVVTVEPGIYLPGVGGVRIEDLAVITETGMTNLTSSAKELWEVRGERWDFSV